MDSEQKDKLVKAWEMSHNILKEIDALSDINEMMAYGAIRTAEAIVDLKVVNQTTRLQREK